MIVAAIAIVCSTLIVSDGKNDENSLTDCHEILVSSSELGPLSMQECLMGAPALAEWMEREQRGKWLKGWRCVLGDKRINQ
jgi:hypothetical protein